MSISDADRVAGLDYVATVPHGVDLDGLPFTRDPGPGLVSFGRIHPDKGVHTAIEIARLSGRPLTICGIVQDERYFTERVAPHVDGERGVFLGAVGPCRRAEILGASTALLHPTAFDEPFGLSVVESMACGTPVAAYARGPCDCRARARQRFGADRMVTDHLAVHDGLVRGPRRGSGRTDHDSAANPAPLHPGSPAPSR